MNCLHTKTVTEITGSITFSGGEILDTIQERVICLDCGENVIDIEDDDPVFEIDAEPIAVFIPMTVRAEF